VLPSSAALPGRPMNPVATVAIYARQSSIAGYLRRVEVIHSSRMVAMNQQYAVGPLGDRSREPL
jgi:hypothetical protein